MSDTTAKQSAEHARNQRERGGNIAKRFSPARALFVGLAMLALAGCNMDSTDNHIEGKRSGMSLLIDHGTGCQYLSVGRSLTPRIASDGKTHMGCRDAAPARGGM
jgi:hypothetical protein